jgi:prepilin-type processing-associated H-X9-DG protein
MNAYFRYDHSNGSRAVETGTHPGRVYGGLARADKTLMFAELPTYDPETKRLVEDPSGPEADCTLQYKASVGGKQYNASWSGKAESIGFVHKMGKREYCAHVAFADGHTEKFAYSEAGIGMQALTALLCEGVDVAFGKNGYQFVNGSNQMDAND